jgi:hypothetical protein
VDVPAAAEPLLALPPSRFTAERNALAKALAARGDPAAAAVKKVPRPVGLAWVLNRLARERPRDLAALLAAGDRLRAGQRRALSGGGADELRAADDELRARARTLRAEAERILSAEGRPAAAATLARVELLLRVTAPQPGPARQALERGVLVREPEVAGGGELTGFAVVPGGRGAASPAAGGRRGAPLPGPSAVRESHARAERDARAAEAEERERRRHAERARREARAAGERARREERAAAKAAERSRIAAERAARARAEAERLEARAGELERRT